jgi:hypothetical protein
MRRWIALAVAVSALAVAGTALAMSESGGADDVVSADEHVIDEKAAKPAVDDEVKPAPVSTYGDYVLPEKVVVVEKVESPDVASEKPEEQPKEEPKEQPKEEPKEQPKEQPKEEPKEEPTEEELPKWEFSAHQMYGECAESPPYDVFHGTGEPGSVIHVVSEYGGGETTVGEDGGWELEVIFESAPVGQAFPVKVKDVHGNKQVFEFIRTG